MNATPQTTIVATRTLREAFPESGHGSSFPIVPDVFAPAGAW